MAARRHAGEGVELVDQIRLVEVAGIQRPLRPPVRRSIVDPGDQALELR